MVVVKDYRVQVYRMGILSRLSVVRAAKGLGKGGYNRPTYSRTARRLSPFSHPSLNYGVLRIWSGQAGYPKHARASHACHPRVWSRSPAWRLSRKPLFSVAALPAAPDCHETIGSIETSAPGRA